MPQIIVTAGDTANLEGTVTLRERINASDFESERFAVNLLERLGWAVSDATEAELRTTEAELRTTEVELDGSRVKRRAADRAADRQPHELVEV